MLNLLILPRYFLLVMLDITCMKFMTLLSRHGNAKPFLLWELLFSGCDQTFLKDKLCWKLPTCDDFSWYFVMILLHMLIISLQWCFPLFSILDLNECDSNTHNCSAQATCSNKPGTFSCECKNGWSGDGTNCTSKYAKYLMIYYKLLK